MDNIRSERGLQRLDVSESAGASPVADKLHADSKFTPATAAKPKPEPDSVEITPITSVIKGEAARPQAHGDGSPSTGAKAPSSPDSTRDGAAPSLSPVENLPGLTLQAQKDHVVANGISDSDLFLDQQKSALGNPLQQLKAADGIFNSSADPSGSAQKFAQDFLTGSGASLEKKQQFLEKEAGNGYLGKGEAEIISREVESASFRQIAAQLKQKDGAEQIQKADQLFTGEKGAVNLSFAEHAMDDMKDPMKASELIKQAKAGHLDGDRNDIVLRLAKSEAFRKITQAVAGSIVPRGDDEF